MFLLYIGAVVHRVRRDGLFRHEFLVAAAGAAAICSLYYISLACDLAWLIDNSDLRSSFVRPPVFAFVTFNILYIINGRLYEVFDWIRRLFRH